MLFRRIKIQINTSIVLSAIASAVILFIPLAHMCSGGAYKIITYGIGILFWMSMIMSQVMFWWANKGRQTIEQHLRRKGIKRLHADLPGVFLFFQNKEAMIADTAVIVSVVLIVVTLLLKVRNEWMIVISAAVLLLSFNLHCIFNGINYKYIRFIRKKQQKEIMSND